MALGIDEAVRELKSLSKQKPLEGDDLEKFKELCIFLRENGFTNAEIAKMTGGRYKEVTIKQYTRGARVKSTKEKEKALDLLSGLVDQGLNLFSVDYTMQLEARLGKKNLSVSEVGEFLDQVVATKTDIATIGILDARLRELQLTLTKAPSIIQYIEQMNAKGLQAGDVKAVHEAAAKFGPPQQIVQAINSYGSKLAIDKAAAASEERRAKMDASLAEAENNFKSIQEKAQAASQSLRILSRLEKEGLTESKMLQIETMCTRLGGLEQAERKVSGYANLQQLENEINLRKDELRQIEEDMAYRQKVNGVAEKLLTKFKFNLSAIDEFYAAAETCGEPIEMIRRMNRLGDLQKIESEVEKMDRELAANEIRFEAATGALQILSDSIEALKKQQKELVENIVGEISEAFKKATNSIAVEHQKGIKRLADFEEKYAEVTANSVFFEDQLKMARIVTTVQKYPAEVLEWPLELAVQLLEATARFCRTKSTNPKIELNKELEKYGLTYIASAEIEFLQLVEWATKALEMHIGRSRKRIP